MKITARWSLALLGWLGFSTGGGAANGLPELVLPQGLGVNIHFTRGHERDLDLIAAAGFKFVRMDFSWGGTERRRGEYDWSAYDELTTRLDQRGLRAIYILDYSNPVHEETVLSRNPITGREQRDVASPQKPESVAAFARWAAAAAEHYKGRGIIWEIWNEPNISFWKPKPDVRQYTTLALATCRAVRAADPEATVIAPATSEFPWAFFESFFASGVLEYLDAVSVHPYRNYSRGPETAGEDYRRLRALIEQYAPPAKAHLPIISGEWGYATHSKGGVSLDVQAAFIVRQQLANLYAGVPLSIWYDWKNDGTNAAYNEDNFGTVTYDLAPKPSYRAVQTLARELSGYRVGRRLEAGPDYVLLLVNDAGEQKLAAWSTGEPREFSLKLPLEHAEQVTAVDGQGRPATLKFTPNHVALSLQATPQYVTFRKPLRELSAAAAWKAGPVRTRVEAGMPETVQVPVTLTNPLPVALAIDLRLVGLPEALVPGAKLSLKPGETRTETLHSSLERRWPARIPAQLKVELAAEDRPGRPTPLGTWTESFEFVLANPIDFQLAPVEGGLRLRISQPSESPLAGVVRVGTQEQPVRLSREHPEAVVRLAADSPGPVQVLNARGAVVADMPAPRFEPVRADRLRAALDGDAAVPAQASLVWTNAPGGDDRPYAQAWQLNYQFDTGWRFVRATPERAVLELPARPQALGLWIYGDNSGNALRLRVTDAGQQTFQPSGPDLTWTGWRWVEFDLADLKAAGHWGGANDGVARGALRLDTLLLVDGTRKKTAGTIYFAGPRLVYRETL